LEKSRNIKKRVNQHFTGSSSKSKKIQLEVFDVTYEETGSELIALLKEAEEIKINKPKYNRSLKKTIFSLVTLSGEGFEWLYCFKNPKNRCPEKGTGFHFQVLQKPKVPCSR
jgi:excinuclease UvrABC nuclease subunit